MIDNLALQIVLGVSLSYLNPLHLPKVSTSVVAAAYHNSYSWIVLLNYAHYP